MLPDPAQGHRRAGIPVSGATWRDRHIRGERLDGIVFHRCTFDAVVLTDASLRGAMLVECEVNGLVLDGCEVADLTLANCRGAGVRLERAPFASVTLARCRLDSVDIDAGGERLIVSEGVIGRLAFGPRAERQHQLTVSGAEIETIVAPGARWEQASLVGADLTRLHAPRGRFRASSFIESEGDGADLSGFVLERCNFFASSLRGIRIRDARECIFAACAMEDADLEGAELGGSIFPEAGLERARLAGAKLGGALFPKANLRGADLRGAGAARSVWTGADLEGATARGLEAPWGVFRDARMAGMDVAGADLSDADLHGVEEALDGACLERARRTAQRIDGPEIRSSPAPNLGDLSGSAPGSGLPTG